MKLEMPKLKIKHEDSQVINAMRKADMAPPLLTSAHILYEIHGRIVRRQAEGILNLLNAGADQ